MELTEGTKMSDRKDSFIAAGNWYKGNTHCHTTISDGKVAPEEVVEIYKAHGYSFLAITDHNIYDYSAQFSTPEFLTFPAVECNVSVAGTTSKCYHLVGYSDGGDGMFPMVSGRKSRSGRVYPPRRG
jgi:hypothetical protein